MKTGPTDEKIEADIEANGCGIDEEVLRKVFTMTEADFTEEYTGDELMAMLRSLKDLSNGTTSKNLN